MLADAERREDGWFRDRVYDVCVIGTGPAGISLARKLASHGRTVGLFEGGNLEPTAESQEIYEGKIVGHAYFPLDAARLRFFGGTSNHWNGWCRPLEAQNFELFAFHRYSGWPIRKPDLDPYAAETDAMLDFLPEEHPAEVLPAGAPLAPFMFRFSAPTRFGPKYKAEIAASDKIDLFLNANLVDLDLAESHRQVSHGIFRSYARPDPFTVRAKYFVLCLGGLENPRFLLNANRQVATGIGNENDLVGRFFCDHLIFDLGEMLLSQELRNIRLRQQFYCPHKALLEEQEILDFGLRVEIDPERRLDGPRRRMFRIAACSVDAVRRVIGEIEGRAVVCDDAHLAIQTAQELKRDSRVALGRDRDRFGQRRLTLDWRLSELEKKTMKIAALEFGAILANGDRGRLRIRDWVLDPSPTFPGMQDDEVAGYHHMCTTRMSDDPKTGVVDKDCRVHAMENLYIGGSSVFSTTGFANPTYTIVQLALRLGDHLDRKLRNAA